MRCRHFLSFVFVVSLALFSGLFITTRNSYAISVTCTGSITNMSTGVSLTTGCDTSTLDQTARWYYRFSVTNSPNFISYKNNARLCFIPASNYSCSSSATTTDSSFAVPIDNYRLTRTFAPFFFRDSSNNQRLLYLGSYNFNSTFSGSINYEFFISDVAPFETPTCSPAPSGELEITENGTYDVTDYASAVVDITTSGGGGVSDEKMDSLIQSLYVLSATLLVLYFFYCIYRLIIKNSGVH